MNAQIEALARQKDFAALNPEERSLVLAEMSGEAYDSLHQLLRAASRQHAQADPPARLRANLAQQMRTQAKAARSLGKTGGFALLWRSAAIFILGMATAMLMRKTVVVEKVVLDKQLRIDTVYVDNIQWRERVQWKTKVLYVEKTPTGSIANAPTMTEPDTTLPEFNSKDLNKTAVGTSLGDTPELMQFFTEGGE